ncbi:hypothetical protein DWX08_02530 [Ruminococcus sp. AF18-22]|nr:hypothetical protein DWX08_02530 [Ruminococcus sp. AF18-22]
MPRFSVFAVSALFLVLSYLFVIKNDLYPRRFSNPARTAVAFLTCYFYTPPSKFSVYFGWFQNEFLLNLAGYGFSMKNNTY